MYQAHMQPKYSSDTSGKEAPIMLSASLVFVANCYVCLCCDLSSVCVRTDKNVGVYVYVNVCVRVCVCVREGVCRCLLMRR